MNLLWLFLVQIIVNIFVYQILKRSLKKYLRQQNSNKEIQDIVIAFNQQLNKRVSEFQTLTKQFKDNFLISQKEFTAKEKQLQKLLEKVALYQELNNNPNLTSKATKKKKNSSQNVFTKSKKITTTAQNDKEMTKKLTVKNSSLMNRQIPSTAVKNVASLLATEQKVPKSTYYVKKNNKLVAKDSLSTAEQIFALHHQGLSIHQISKEMNLTAMEVNFHLLQVVQN